METDAGHPDLLKLAVEMLTSINEKPNFLNTREASLTEVECVKRGEFSVAAFSLNARLTEVIASLET